MDEAMVNAALGDLDNPEVVALLPAPTIAALRLTDELTTQNPEVTAEFHTELLQHFSQTQVLELGSALAVASGWQKFIEAFGIKPDSWNPAMPDPVRPGS